MFITMDSAAGQQGGGAQPLQAAHDDQEGVAGGQRAAQ